MLFLAVVINFVLHAQVKIYSVMGIMHYEKRRSTYDCPDREKEFDKRRDKKPLKRLHNMYKDIVILKEVSFNCGNAV